MSDIRLVKKEDNNKLKNIKFGINADGIKKLESEAKASFEALKTFETKLSKQEFLTKDDLKAYKSAMNGYIDNSNRLRSLDKVFGQGYTEQQEKEWNDSVSSMQNGYKKISDCFSDFKTADEFNKAKYHNKYYAATFEELEEAKKRVRESLKNNDGTSNIRELAYLTRLTAGNNKTGRNIIAKYRNGTLEERNAIIDDLYDGYNEYKFILDSIETAQERSYKAAEAAKVRGEDGTQYFYPNKVKEDIYEYFEFNKDY